MSSAAAKWLGPSWRRNATAAALLFVLTFAAFGPALHAGYIWDDDMFVTQNPLLTAADGLRRIWFSFDSPSQYFPLTYTSFYFERKIWGLNPAGYHLVNLLIHAGTAVLLWRALSRLRIPGAWLGAALFGVHPLQVESVAWVAERKNILMGFFFMLTLLAWIKFIDSEGRKRWGAYAAGLFLYALSLCAKTTACTLPAALVLILWLRKSPIDRRRWLQIAPFVVMAAAMAVVSVFWEHSHPGLQEQKLDIGMGQRLLIACHALWFYVGKLFWPAHLTVDYPRWNISASNPLAYVWVVLTVAIVAVVWRLRRRAGRALETGLLFYAATLAPMLGLVMHYMYVYSFVADHFQYLACIGILTLAASGLILGADRLRRPWLKWALGGPAVATLVVLTWTQCQLYANPETLWRATLQINPESWVAEGSLGTLAFQDNQFDDAIFHYKKALQINPRFSELHYDLGRTYFQMGQMDNATEEYRKELELFPGNFEARDNLGYILMHSGKIDAAIGEFQTALRANPNYPSTHDLLGEALLKKGDWDGAIGHL